MPQNPRQIISVGNLLLDPANFRITKQDSQKATRDALIEEEGRSLVNLAKDIVAIGLSPIDLQLVYEADDGNGNFVVIEGNRRLAAIQLMLNPELAEGTEFHTAFKRLNKDSLDSVPRVMECVIVPTKQAGRVWIDRKHASGLEGAGTETWSAMSKARADQDAGFARPELDAVNFVLTNPKLPDTIHRKLQGSSFNLTTLKRLVDTKELGQAAGFMMQDGKLISSQDKNRVMGLLTEVVQIIATGKHGSEKFIERNIDTADHRQTFVDSVIANHPERKKATPWVVSGKPVKAKLRKAKAKGKTTPSTADQTTLIAKAFRLELPSGKINDIFTEMKSLDVARYRHAVSILLRVFIESSLDAYIAKHGIKLPLDKQGKTNIELRVRLAAVNAHVRSTSLMTHQELKPIDVAMSDKNSLLAPNTLHAYVHSPWMNPDPMQLKTSWLNVRVFIERLWGSVIKAGQP
jgi:hypothetical protein